MLPKLPPATGVQGLYWAGCPGRCQHILGGQGWRPSHHTRVAQPGSGSRSGQGTAAGQPCLPPPCPGTAAEPLWAAGLGTHGLLQSGTQCAPGASGAADGP